MIDLIKLFKLSRNVLRTLFTRPECIRKIYFKKFIFIFIFIFSKLIITGNIILYIKDVYQLGENIDGGIKLELKGKDFIPASTNVLIEIGDNLYRYYLRDLVDEDPIEGNFYFNGEFISERGQGYGSPI